MTDNEIVVPQTVLALRGSNGVAKEWAMVPLWLRSWLPRSSNSVNYNTNAMSPSKTHQFLKNLIEMLQNSLIFQYFFNIFLSGSLLVALGHHGTRLLPDYVQIASRLLPDCLQITSRLPPDYLRLLPDYFQIDSRLRPDYFHDTSRLLPDFQFTKKIASRFPIYQNCLGSRAGVILLAAGPYLAQVTVKAPGCSMLSPTPLPPCDRCKAGEVK